jgi:hypothetical protein
MCMKNGWRKCIICIYSVASRFARRRFAPAFSSPSPRSRWHRAAGAAEVYDNQAVGPLTAMFPPGDERTP